MRNPFLNVVAFSFSAISHMSTYISIYIYIHKYENGTIQENVKKTTRLTGRPSAVWACQTTIPVMLFVAYKNINKYKLHKSNLFFYCHAHK